MIEPTYTVEQKLDIVLSVLSRKKTTKQVSDEQHIAYGVICQWKKRALDAMREGFRPKPKGRKKVEKAPVVVKEESKEVKAELRKARARATRMETFRKRTQGRMDDIEKTLKVLAEQMGYKLRKK